MHVSLLGRLSILHRRQPWVCVPELGIDAEEFEAMFCHEKQQLKTPGAGKAARARRDRPADGGSFLDLRRVNNVSIGLNRFQKLVASNSELATGVASRANARCPGRCAAACQPGNV